MMEQLREFLLHQGPGAVRQGAVAFLSLDRTLGVFRVLEPSGGGAFPVSSAEILEIPGIGGAGEIE